MEKQNQSKDEKRPSSMTSPKKAATGAKADAKTTTKTSKDGESKGSSRTGGTGGTKDSGKSK